MTHKEGFDTQNQHWLKVHIYYEDTDFTGVVYHANYLKYYERGRSRFLTDAGLRHTDLLNRPDPAAMTLTQANVRYKQAARIDDVLWVRTRLLGSKGARIFFQQACLRGDVVICEADLTAVMIHTDGRPRKPVAEVVTIMTPLVFEDVS